MSTRVAVVSIIVENRNSIETLNDLLFEYRQYIIGRMGIPYKARDINLICVAVDAPEDIINSLSGKIGKLDGVSVKINFSNVISTEE